MSKTAKPEPAKRNPVTTIRSGGLELLMQGVGVLALLFLSLPVAWADAAAVPQTGDILDLSIEELRTIKVATVTGASKYRQKVTDAPSSVSVITADDIRKFGYRTLADILRSIRSFYVTYDRNYSYPGLRGFNHSGDYNTRLLLLVDGHRINDNIYDQAQIGTEFPLDVDLIDRIEIIRGPGSSLYGSNAFFSVISVITKTGGAVNGADVSASAAGFETYSGRATYGVDSGNGLNALLSGTSYASDGNRRLYYPEFDTPSNNHGIAEGRDGDRAESAFSKISFRDFTLAGAYGYREKEIPTASFGTIFNTPDNRTIDEHAYLDLTYQHAYGREASALARVYYDAYNFSEDYVMNAPPITPNRDISRGRWWGGELRNTAIFFTNHRVTAGAEYQDNLRQDQANFDVDPFFSYLDVKKGSYLWAWYLQDEYRMHDTLLFNLGVRHDHYSTFGSETNPRLALIYSPLEKTAFKLLYGTAFRAPNVYESYYADGETAKANPELKPEKITTSELVYEQYLGNHFRSSLSLFRYRISNLIALTTDPADGLMQFRNLDHVEARGSELELEGAWSNGMRGRISCTAVQKATDRSRGELLTNSPEHLAKLNLIIPVLKEWLFVDPEVQYTSRRKTAGGAYADAFTVANLTVFGRDLVKGLDASISAYNLFDQKYGDPGAGPPQHIQDVIEQDGRSYRVKLTYRF